MQFRYRAEVQLSLFFHISSATYQASVLDLLLKNEKRKKTIYAINKIKIIKTCPKKENIDKKRNHHVFFTGAYPEIL